MLLLLLMPCSNRVFGCMKGAADGGLDVPHSEKRFPGYDRDTKSYDVSLTWQHVVNHKNMQIYRLSS